MGIVAWVEKIARKMLTEFTSLTNLAEMKQVRLTEKNTKSIKKLIRDKGWNLLTENKVANLAVEAGVPIISKKKSA